MEFPRATTADAATLAAMNCQLIRDERHRNRMTVAELEARMAAWLEGEYEAVLFTEVDQPVGYALYRRDSEYIYLRQFFIRPESRRRGAGRAAIAWLRRNQWGIATRVRVEVLVHNTAGVAFWRSVGFEDYCLTLELDGGASSVSSNVS